MLRRRGICIYLFICIFIYIYMYMFVYVYVYIYIYIHIHIHTCIHTSIHIHIHTYMYNSNSQYNLLVGKLDRQIEKVYEEFFSKIKEGVVYSFYQRCGQYDSDIRRLDSFRCSPQFDFRQLFLVKESLALMYQLMQLPQV
jgi:hypothetical protein